MQRKACMTKILRWTDVVENSVLWLGNLDVLAYRLKRKEASGS